MRSTATAAREDEHRDVDAPGEGQARGDQDAQPADEPAQAAPHQPWIESAQKTVGDTDGDQRKTAEKQIDHGGNCASNAFAAPLACSFIRSLPPLA